MSTIKQIISLSFLLLTTIVFAQPIEGTLNWYNQEGQGMHTEKAYKYLKKKKSETVIVGVIDSGVDIEHKDLAGQIWVNEDEIPGNGIDDDNNGYIDDIHGWNFLGNISLAKKNFPQRLKISNPNLSIPKKSFISNSTTVQVPPLEIIIFSVFVRRVKCLSVIITCIFIFANSIAIAAPIPSPAPVINEIFLS